MTPGHCSVCEKHRHFVLGRHRPDVSVRMKSLRKAKKAAAAEAAAEDGEAAEVAAWHHSGAVFPGGVGSAPGPYAAGEPFGQGKKATAYGVIKGSADATRWLPTLEVFAKRKEAESGSAALHSCGLAGATAHDAQADKKCAVVTVATEDGQFFRFGVPVGDRGTWVSAIASIAHPAPDWVAAADAAREEAEAVAAEAAAAKEREDIVIAEAVKKEAEATAASSRQKLEELAAILATGNADPAVEEQMAALRKQIAEEDKTVADAEANLQREIQESLGVCESVALLVLKKLVRICAYTCYHLSCEDADAIAKKEREEADVAKVTAEAELLLSELFGAEAERQPDQWEPEAYVTLS